MSNTTKEKAAWARRRLGTARQDAKVAKEYLDDIGDSEGVKKANDAITSIEAAEEYVVDRLEMDT